MPQPGAKIGCVAQSRASSTHTDSEHPEASSLSVMDAVGNMRRPRQRTATCHALRIYVLCIHISRLDTVAYPSATQPLSSGLRHPSSKDNWEGNQSTCPCPFIERNTATSLLIRSCKEISIMRARSPRNPGQLTCGGSCPCRWSKNLPPSAKQTCNIQDMLEESKATRCISVAFK